MRKLFAAMTTLLAVACGSTPPPAPSPPPTPTAEPVATAPEPVMQQELGSIDDGAVEQKFVELSAPLETCHAAGRARVGALAGDVTVFLRIDAKGAVRYSYFEMSTLGDRDTEKCILDLLASTTWPAPTGGEAEVRHSLGWDAGQERPPTSWEPEKVISALDASSATKRAVEQCKRGVSGAIRMTGYVLPGTPTPDASSSPKKKKKSRPKKPKKAAPVQTGHFRALGGASASHDGSDKVDCMVSALKDLTLPSPGSGMTKVTFAP